MIQRIITRGLLISAIMFTGCGGGDPAQSEKDARLAELPAGKADWSSDLCETLGWYGDGECDAFCPQTDADCDICEARNRYSDGLCDVVCVRPDPDCDLVCPEPETGPAEGWNRTIRSSAAAHAGQANHAMSAVVINPGDDFVLEGRFNYGLALKDLEAEEVVAYLDLGGCTWTEVGRATTDDQGWVRIPVPGTTLMGPGNYEARLVALGDMSRAAGTVSVVTSGAHAVVFDIDGTLTVSDFEVFDEALFGGSAAGHAQNHAVVNAYVAAGYQIIYITGRPFFLHGGSRRWLTVQGMPRGPVFTARTLDEVLPTPEGVGAFKLAVLQDLSTRPGLVLSYAYGNAPTDICAYAEAGVDPANTYIIGPHGGEACAGFAPTQAIADYITHLPDLATLPPAP